MNISTRLRTSLYSSDYCCTYSMDKPILSNDEKMEKVTTLSTPSECSLLLPEKNYVLESHLDSRQHILTTNMTSI